MNTRSAVSNMKGRLFLVATLIITVLLLGSQAGCTSSASSAKSNVLTQTLTEPLGDVKSAKFEIKTDTGNLSVDHLTGGEPLLAGGTLEYLENQEVPYRSLTTIGEQANLIWSAEGGKKTGLRLPWEACTGETDWLIHLNPGVSYDITAHSGGGNVKLDFTGLLISNLTSDTGGGNMDVVLPDNTANLSVTAKTGAGNVTVKIGSGITGSHIVNASSGAGDVLVRLPGGIAARIHITNGMGKAIIDSSFRKIDDQTYQSAGYDSAANKVEITLNSGAGNVSVETK